MTTAERLRKLTSEIWPSEYGHDAMRTRLDDPDRCLWSDIGRVQDLAKQVCDQLDREKQWRKYHEKNHHALAEVWEALLERADACDVPIEDLEAKLEEEIRV